MYFLPLKDELLNMYLVQQLGFSAMGYVGWAKKWAEAPLRVVLDNTNRVMFPIYSRYQDDKERVGKTLEKVVFYNSLILLPIMAGVYIIMPLLVEIIPQYQKWEVALSSFNFFLISALFVSFTTPFITVFNSIGKVIYSVRFMVLWIVLNWTVVPLSIMFMGYQGVGIAFAINSLSFVFVIYVLKRLVPFHFWSSVRMPITATAGMLLCLLLIKSSVFDPYILTTTLVITGPIIYGLLLYLMGGSKVFQEVKHIFIQPTV
ncbi:MAG: oligosaccharide flippase family protein [Patescibacteria group bacterium]